MIKAVILDIDGVIIGSKPNFNFPNPHLDVIQELKRIRKKGIPISLCTAKPAFAISSIITAAELHNIHITDGGALIIDPIDNIIAKKHTIENEIAQQLISFYYAHNIYLEIFDASTYYIKLSQKNEITVGHAKILQREPSYISDIEDIIFPLDIVKLFIIAKNKEEKQFVQNSFNEQFKGKLTLSWTLHPTMFPLQFGIVTAKGISKKTGAKEISETLNIPLQHILAVGDTEHDWQFMEVCGYAATLENGSEEIKQLVKTKGEGKYYIGPSVDDNGILEVFKYFAL